jgi:hypothetical protein
LRRLLAERTLFSDVSRMTDQEVLRHLVGRLSKDENRLAVAKPKTLALDTGRAKKEEAEIAVERTGKSVGRARRDEERRGDDPAVARPARRYLLRMYLDSDRDGTIDAAPRDYTNWQEGAGNLGAVIMVNTRRCEEGQNVLARMQILFRWDNDTPDPGGAWKATLTIDHPDRVEIYERRVQGAAEVPCAAGVDLHAEPLQALATPQGRLGL